MKNFEIIQKFLKTVLFLTIIFFLSFAAYTQPLFINEFCAINTNILQDEDGDFEDWIEIQNISSSSISLKGFGLSDDINEPYKWTFPDTTILPFDFMLVWASGKNKKTLGQPLHTSWNINSSGEELLITDSIGNTIDLVNAVDLPINISFGRYPNGSNNFYYFNSPTPSFKNENNGVKEVLEPVVFSHQGGFYADEFNLVLSHPDTSAEIYYTLDGSEPNIQNLGGGTYIYKKHFPFVVGSLPGDTLIDTLNTFAYNSGTTISLRFDSLSNYGLFTKIPNHVFYQFLPNNFNIDSLTPSNNYTTNLIRARAIKPNAINSSIKSNTYFINPIGRGRFELPIVSIALSPDKIIGYENGIYTPGADFLRWKRLNNTEQANCFTPANYNRRGREFEYESNIEFFEPNSNFSAFNIRTGIRNNGKCGRALPIKSLRLYFRAEYGEEKLNYDIFNNGVDDYKRIILRNGGDDQFDTYMKDPLVHQICEPLSFEKQEYRPAILFLNGEYWGIHNIRERHDDEYIEQIFGINKDSVYIVEEPIDEALNNGEIGASEFSSLHNFIIDNDISDSSNYEYVKSKMDINNFIDYSLANIYFGNTDWGDRNVRAWRTKNENINLGVKEFDAKWRWMMHDVDDSFGIQIDDSNYVYINVFPFLSSWYSINVSNFINNAEFAKNFSNRFCDILNSAFKPERTITIIDSLKHNIESSIPEHSNRWKAPFGISSLQKWNQDIDLMKNFVLNRDSIQREQIKDYFQLDSSFVLNVDVSDSIHGYVKVNTIDINANTAGVFSPVYPWVGKYFKNLSIDLIAKPNYGWIFSHWEGAVNGISDSVNVAFNADSIYIKAVFTPDTTIFPDSLVIHYWHFNDLPSGELTQVNSDSSKIGLGHIEYTGVSNGYMDVVNDGSELNLHFNEIEGSGLRVRNPSDNRFLEFSLPTYGYENINFKYDIKRTNNGAQKQVLQYSTNNGVTWNNTFDTLYIFDTYQSVRFSFASDSLVNNNPNFKIRILFTGLNSDANSGNNRFDNVALYGKPIDCEDSLLHYFSFNNLADDSLNQVVSDFSFSTNNQAKILFQGNSYLDRVEDGSYGNIKLNETDGFALRARNPSENNDLLFNASTKGFANIHVSFVYKRTNNGAEKMLFYARKDSLSNWETVGDTVLITEDYKYQHYDLSNNQYVNNNENLQFKINFYGENAANLSGNVRFDNIAFMGKELLLDTVFETICNRDSLFFVNDYYKVKGEYLYVNEDTSCVKTGQLLYLEVLGDSTFISESVCDSFYFENGFIVSSGTYYDTLTSSYGCDSIIALDLTILQSSDTTINVSSCEQFSFNGEVLSQSGIYLDTLQNIHGCDSIISLNLEIFRRDTTVLNINACSEYIFDNTVLNNSGVYYETYQNQNGCDSIVQLVLEINNSTDTLINTTSCYNYDFNGVLLTSSGIYTDTLQNTEGCDSIITIDLEILNSDTITIDESSCNEYIFDNTVLNNSGIYYETYQNQNGCDSVVQLVLEIISPTDTVLNINSCESYDFNGVLISETGVYFDTLLNTNGCDSLVTLNLNIFNSNDSIVEVSVCDSFIFNGNALYSSGIYYNVFQNQYSCDSLVILSLEVVEINTDLTVDGSSITVAEPNNNNTYQWVDCDNNLESIDNQIEAGFSPSLNGEYAVIVSRDSCYEISDCISITNVSNLKTNYNSSIKIFPNPNSGFFTASFYNFPKNEKYSFKIYNSIGKLIFNEVLLLNESNYKKEINISSFSKGMYNLVIGNDNLIITEKIIIN